ncbi:MAG: hypothetical protein IJE08_07925 [Clostridia bacterium]|nr:hypothetical protein [Clostridia bacterium]
MKHLSVDFNRIVGPIKPVNGVNNGPMTCNFSQDARPYFKEAAFPFARLHDSEYPMGSGEFVDVDCIFKVFSCDEDDPANYNFTLTDEYLKAIDETGAKIIYRLGATIEHQPVKVHAHPPKDYMKWARICEHIIRHYNEGWADGLHLNIEYWEIWNEPELSGHQCWTGTTEEYCEFYKTVVPYLKEKFPHLKFGGPAVSSPKNEFARQFLEAITADGQRAPLDFYSWHMYLTDPKKAGELACHTRAMLDEFGYTEAESIYDEWNYVNDWSNVRPCYKVISGRKGAAFNAAMLCVLQHSPCDISTYYDAQVKQHESWCGLFAPTKETVHGEAGLVELKKGYYAFKAFAELARLGMEAESVIEDGNIFVCAAASDEGKAVMLVNYSDDDCKAERVQVKLTGAENTKMKVLRLCGTKNLDRVGELTGEGTITLLPHSVTLLTDK